VKYVTSEVERVCTAEMTLGGVVTGYNRMLSEWNNVGRAILAMMWGIQLISPNAAKVVSTSTDEKLN
jgi:hypothetical protein